MNTREREKALEDRLLLLAGIPTVVFPNTNDNPPADGSVYLRVNFIHTPPERPHYSTTHRRRSIMQVTVLSPEGEGQRPAQTLADSIAGQFPVDLRLAVVGGETVTIPREPHVANGFNDQQTGKFQVPVSIDYEVIS